MRKSACPPLLPIRAREVIVFLKTRTRTRAAQGRCAVPDDQVDQRYQQIQRRRSLDQHSLVTMWRGSFCTTLWRNNDFFVFGLVGTKHLLISWLAAQRAFGGGHDDDGQIIGRTIFQS